VEEIRNIKITVEYEGARYFGWQSQSDCLTVQGELEKAIARVVNHPVVIYGSGRTDRGVHALGQVANFRTRKSIPPQKLLLGINTYLPADIRVRAVEDVPDEFHARHSARGKRYRYTILQSLVDRVMARRYCAVVRNPLEVGPMRAAARCLKGEHDFRAFQGNAKRRKMKDQAPPRSTVRTVNLIAVKESRPYVFIDVFGRGFLYNMVRTIAGTLMEIGSGKRPPENMEEILQSLDRRRAGFTAPARGLCLISVYYDEGNLQVAARAAEGEEQDLEDISGKEHERHLKLLI